MSGLGAAALRELGAVPRKFLTVKGALLWYRDQLVARGCRSCNLAGIGSPRNQAKMDETVATFAAITQCLREYDHPADDQEDGLAIVPVGRWKSQPTWGAGEALLWLVAWYENNSDDGSEMALDAGLELPQRRNPDAEWLARKAGLERRAFSRRCKTVVHRLGLRFRFAGLLVDA